MSAALEDIGMYIKIVEKITLSNGHRNGETPEPIPNSEAKPVHDVMYCSIEWERALPFGLC